MPFRDNTLEECLAHAATPEQWQEYELVRHARQPELFSAVARLMGASESYRRKDALEFEIWESVLQKLVSGEWRAVGRWNDEPGLRPIDPRLWRTLHVNELSFRYNRVWSAGSSEAFSDILVSQAGPERRTGEHVSKSDERKNLRAWFAARVEAGDSAQSKPKWLAAAEEEFPQLSKNQFHEVWVTLGRGHPLKLKGRPRE